MQRRAIYISRIPADSRWSEELKVHLMPQAKQHGVEILEAEEGAAGEGATAAVALLLVSARYLASTEVIERELPPLLESAGTGRLRVLWAPVSASSYSVTAVNELQAAADPARPLDTLSPTRRNEEWRRIAAEAVSIAAGLPCSARLEEPRVAILYKRGADPDEPLVSRLIEQLQLRGCRLFVDRDMPAGVRWGKALADEIRSADAVIPLLSAASASSEMLAYEVYLASDAAQHRSGRPRLIPVRVRLDGPLPESLELLNPIQQFQWNSEADDPRLIAEIMQTIHAPDCDSAVNAPISGAIPAGDGLYIERDADAEFAAALQRREPVILIKGARQMGRTSLLARGLAAASGSGARVIYTDFQRFNLSQLSGIESMYRSLAESMEDSVPQSGSVDDIWTPDMPPNRKLEKFLKQRIFSAEVESVVWGMDEVDRLFTFAYATEFFGLIRSWHNRRTVKPGSIWDRLSVVIAYATEPFLFIQDLNQSPFNVGHRIAVRDFTLRQVMRMNDLFGTPLKTHAEVERFYDLVGGQPYLVRRGLYEVRNQPFARFAEHAARDDGPFSDHLRRILVLLADSGDLLGAVERVLRGSGALSTDQYFRLQRAGVITGESPQAVRMRCELYRQYLERHLAGEGRAMALLREV